MFLEAPVFGKGLRSHGVKGFCFGSGIGHLFLDNVFLYRTASVRFLVLMNSATKIRFSSGLRLV